MDFPSWRYAQRPGRRIAVGLVTSLFCGTAILAYAQAMPGSHTVLMEAVRFSPLTLEVRAGDTIVWKNRDAFPHNVTAENAQFHSGGIAPGQTWKFRAGKQGLFSYVCTLHPGMKAVLVVN